MAENKATSNDIVTPNNAAFSVPLVMLACLALYLRFAHWSPNGFLLVEFLQPFFDGISKRIPWMIDVRRLGVWIKRQFGRRHDFQISEIRSSVDLIACSFANEDILPCNKLKSS